VNAPPAGLPKMAFAGAIRRGLAWSLADSWLPTASAIPSQCGLSSRLLCLGLCDCGKKAPDQRDDPCLLDTFIAAVRYMAGEPKKPWWKYTAERKRELAARCATTKTITTSRQTESETPSSI
jgi:Pathogenicity locus